MKKLISILFSALLIVTICLSTLSGCDIIPQKETSEERLYNWLLENGELINGTRLVYTDNNFSLHYDTSYAHKLFVTYSVTDYKGYQVETKMPLFIEDEKVLANITLINAEGFTRGLEYYHTPQHFTNKTPIEHGDTTGDTISMADYPHEYVDGKIVVKVPEEDKPKIEELEKMNALCEELAHDNLCSILDWLSEKICPSAEMDIADFGYEAYK
jgi:hypothetical protein